MTTRARRGRGLWALVAGLGLGLAADSAGQVREDDPRFVKDPREVADPRDVQLDPREVELDPHAVPEGRDLFEALLLAGDDGRLRVAMVDNPWLVLGFIDQTCHRRLVMTEAGEATGETGRLLAEDLERQALHLATLADGGLRDSRFVPYVTARLAWDAEQVGRWRQSEAAFAQARTIFNEARSPQDLQRALTPLEQSLETARVLGDVGGQTRSMALIGRIHAELGHAGAAEVRAEPAGPDDLHLRVDAAEGVDQRGAVHHRHDHV